MEEEDTDAKKPVWLAKGGQLGERLWALAIGMVSFAVAIYLFVSALMWAKDWFNSDDAEPSPTEAAVAWKPPRPTGLVILTTTGKEGEATEWYLRADTVKGPREKRLAWVTMDFSKDKTEKYRRGEAFYSMNCDTMEMRTLSVAYYKHDDPNAYGAHDWPYDKADVFYPIPHTGPMSMFEEACKPVYVSVRAL